MEMINDNHSLCHFYCHFSAFRYMGVYYNAELLSFCHPERSRRVSRYIK